jgi:hypothetical protein
MFAASFINTHAGAKIAWVSFHSGDNTPNANAAGAGFTQAPDVEYTRLLAAAGHQVTRYVTTATPDTTLLNTFDIVIISRSVPSGNYQTAASTALWHGLTKPTILMGGYILRNSRLGYTIGGTIPDTAGTIHLLASDPAHPIFTGVSFDAGNLMVNPYANLTVHNGVTQRGISVNTDPPADGATVLATVGTDTDPAFGGMIIAEFPAGTVMANATPDTTAAKRLVFLSGSRETAPVPADGAGIFDLTTDGARLFLNAVNYMAGLPLTEPPPNLSVTSPANGTTQYYALRGLNFTASSGTAGGIPLTNISLTLNGANVSSNLVITGTAQSRSVSYTNLAENTTYTAVITVRDDGGREVSQTINFDTLPPYSLAESFAFSTDALTGALPGFKARIVEGYGAPTLANSLARAEQQLAGTLIDPGTGEPYPNNATPSTDNPDGAYNQDLINWSVEVGIAERGNFQAPQFPDQPVPGATQPNNLAAEVLTYLELQPGRYTMGVNSDDGFVVTTGANPKDVFAKVLGRFDGGRGSADTTFQFLVTKAGLYPFRLVYYQGDGGGNVEWFMQDPLTGEKILLNDRANTKAIRAWRQISAQDRPYISSVAPSVGAAGVNTDTNIIFTIQNSGTVPQNSVQLTLNGQTVAPQVTQNNGVTTVTYAPSPALQSDTKYTVALSYTDSGSTQLGGTFDFTTRFVPAVETAPAKIVWVSFHNGDAEPSAAAAGAGFTEAPDVGYTKLLAEAGHTITRYVTTPTPDVDFLNTFDLVIISRSVPSGNYQTPESTALWHSITKPTIVMGGYIIRNTRLGYMTGETIPDTAGTVRLNVKAPSHPIFQGVPLDASGDTPNFAHLVSFNGTVQRGISVVTGPVVSGGTVLATISTVGDAANGGMVIGEFPAGTTMADASADITAGKRLVFLSGSRENVITSEGSGIYDLEGAGARMFMNAVRYMAGLTTTPQNISVAAVLANGQITISWPEAGSAGYVLESNTALTAAGWQAVAGTPTSANGTLSLSIPASDAVRFFRLMKP